MFVCSACGTRSSCLRRYAPARSTPVSLSPSCAPLHWPDASARCIHGRARQTTFAEARRKVQRPRDAFESPGIDNRLNRSVSRFVLSPIQPGSKGREAHTSEQRAAMQWSNSAGELLERLRIAMTGGLVDVSVFSAAMQRCGQGRWWDALQEVRDEQLSVGVATSPILCTMYINAMTRSLRSERGFGVVPARQRQVLPFAKAAWDEAGISKHLDFPTAPCALNAALRLCAAVGREPAAFEWAAELWTWGGQCCILDEISYSTFLLVLAVHRMPERVDELLAEAVRRTLLKPNYILLGGLVNVAAEHRDWRRAEELWHVLVDQLGVVANGLAYGARAKAHMSCGRPLAVVSVVDEMLGKGLQAPPEVAESLCQALLVMYHSTLDAYDFLRLHEAFCRGEAMMQSASGWQRRTWEQMKHTADAMRSDPASVDLRDVLVEWKAQRSVMAEWRGCVAGSNYLSASSE